MKGVASDTVVQGSNVSLNLVACCQDDEFVGAPGSKGAGFALFQRSAGAALGRGAMGIVSVRYEKSKSNARSDVKRQVGN